MELAHEVSPRFFILLWAVVALKRAKTEQWGRFVTSEAVLALFEVLF